MFYCKRLKTCLNTENYSTMTPYQKINFNLFLKQVFDCSCEIPSITFDQPEHSLVLFNPCMSFHHMLHYFQKMNWSGVESVVDSDIYESRYQDIHRFNTEYFFSCNPASPKLLGRKTVQNVAGLVYQLSESPAETMTIAEAMIYALFQMYRKKHKVLFDGASVVTRTIDIDINVPLVIGFDSDTISNRIQSYNVRTMMDIPIGTHAVSHKATF